MKSNLACTTPSRMNSFCGSTRVGNSGPFPDDEAAGKGAMLDRRTRRLAAALAIWLGPLGNEGYASGDETLGELIRAHPQCRQFNDGCSICKVENGEAV